MKRTRVFVIAAIVGMFAVPAAVLAADGAAEKASPKGALDPLSFSVSYTMATDYVWRGANLSEYPGEGREKLNHQVAAGISLDLEKIGLKDMGSIGVSVWGEIYQANKSSRYTVSSGSGGDSHVQEVDYTINWTKTVEQLGVDVEAGWIIYEFPCLSGDAYTSYEFYGSLTFNDGKWFGLEDPILSPSIAYNYDYDVVKGGWLALGVSHEFDLGNAAEILKAFTLKPSLTMGIDNRYWDKANGTTHRSTRLATMEYGLDLGYDLGSALGLPEEYGSLGVTSFVRFSNAMRNDNSAGLNDEFYGGFTIGYEW